MDTYVNLCDLRLMPKFSEHYTPEIETGKLGRALKNNRTIKIMNGHETIK